MDKIKLVCFDLNKTLIKENSWLDLNIALGMTPEEDQDLLDRHQAGQITYEQGQKALEEIYKKRGLATKARIHETVLQYTYLPGAKEIVRYLQKKNYIIALISGSIDFLVEYVAKELGIDLFGANNRFIFNKHDHLDEIVTLGEDTTTKLDQLKAICKKLNLKITECACVGDGDNDLIIFKETKHGITFKGSKIEKYAWRVISNLENIKSIL